MEVSSNQMMPAFWLICPAKLYRHHKDQLLLGQLIFFHGSSANAVCALALLVSQVLHVLLVWTVFLFEDGVGFDMLELGFEAVDVMAVGAAVGTTSGVGELVSVVLRLGSGKAPT